MCGFASPPDCLVMSRGAKEGKKVQIGEIVRIVLSTGAEESTMGPDMANGNEDNQPSRRKRRENARDERRAQERAEGGTRTARAAGGRRV